MTKTIQLPCEVFSNNSKRFGTHLNILGTGIFPGSSDGKFKSNKFFLGFHDACNLWVNMGLIIYLEKFNEKNPMNGFIRHLYLTPVGKNKVGGVTIFVHIVGEKTTIVGLHTINNIKIPGKFGGEAFIRNITNKIQKIIDKNVIKTTKTYIPKNQKTIEYKVQYELEQPVFKKLSKTQIKKIIENLGLDKEYDRML